MLGHTLKERKLFQSYFVTYVAVLLIPLITFGCIYSELTNTIREGIENENRILLEQTTNILDTRFKEVESIGIQLINSACVTQLRYLEDPLSHVNIKTLLQARESLPQYSAYNDFLESYLLFFNRGQVVLSSNLTYSYNDFYNQYMHPEDFTQEKWLQDLQTVSSSLGECELRSFLLINGDSVQTRNMIQSSFSFLPSVYQDGKVVLYVDQQRMNDLLQTFGLLENEFACILSPSGQMLAWTDDGLWSEDAIAQLLDNASNNRTFAQYQISGRNTLVSNCTSGQTGLKIIIARSVDGVYARLNGIRWIICAVMLLAILLGVAISYGFSHQNSFLVRSLAQESGASLDGMSYTEALHTLRRSFDEIRTSNNAIQKNYMEQRHYLQRSFLSQMIRGEFANEESAQATARSLKLLETGQPMCVMLFHQDGMSSDETVGLQVAVNCKAVIRIAVDNLEKKALRMDKSESDYVVLLTGEMLQERIEALVDMIRSNLPEAVNDSLYVYVGNTVTRLTDVAHSWDNAYSLIYIQPSPRETKVVYYQEGENPRYTVTYPRDMQNRLIRCVMNADEEGTLEQLNRLKECNQNEQGETPAFILQLLNDNLINTLLQISTMAGMPKDQAESLIGDVRNVMTLPLDMQLQEIRQLYVTLCGSIGELKTGKHQLMDEISDYICQHYMDADLSLTSVAGQFHVSESYLSSTFKMQTGTNFFTYVENMRMDKAKELLRQTNLKISDISTQVGYASVNSFCRAFKRSTGYNATNFRNGTDL